MARNIFKGLGVALVTPFTSDGSVDFKSLTCLVEHLIDNGADFLCILATTSEAPCLSWQVYRGNQRHYQSDIPPNGLMIYNQHYHLKRMAL